MPRYEIEPQTVDLVDEQLSLMDIAGVTDADTGVLTRVVRIPFHTITRYARGDQGGEVDACTEALTGRRSLPGASISRLLGTDGDDDLFIEVSIDARDLFDTVEYDLSNDLADAWAPDSRADLEAALAAWRRRDQHPRVNRVH